MMITFGILITLLLIIVGFIWKRSKIVLHIQCLWFWILCGLNNGGIDYTGNEMIYYSTEIHNLGLINGLQELCGFIGHQMNWDYVTYNAVLCAGGIIIIHYVLSRNSEMPALSMSLLYIFPMMDCVIQKRFFIGMCFALLAFDCWIQKKYWKYMIFSIAAVGFHVSMVLYLLFPVVLMMIRKKKRILILLVLMEFIGFRGIDYLILQTSFAGKYLVYTRQQRYSSILIGILFLILQLLFIVLITRIWRFWRYKGTGEMEEIVNLNISSVLMLPLLLFGSTWQRYYRIIQILNYKFIGNRLSSIKNRKKETYIWIVMYILILIFSNITIISASKSSFDGSFGTVFGNNALLQFIFS